jgi:hypothetical protein
MIKHYLVLEEFDDGGNSSLEKLEEIVQRYIDCGWQPLGGMVVTPYVCDENKYEPTAGMLYLQTITHDGDGRLPE